MVFTDKTFGKGKGWGIIGVPLIPPPWDMYDDIIKLFLHLHVMRVPDFHSKSWMIWLYEQTFFIIKCFLSFLYQYFDIRNIISHISDDIKCNIYLWIIYEIPSIVRNDIWNPRPDEFLLATKSIQMFLEWPVKITGPSELWQVS